MAFIKHQDFKSMKKLIVLVLFAISALGASAQGQAPTNTSNQQTANQYANSKFEYGVIDAPNKTFGYEISADGKVLIRQNSIPGMPGTEGFRTKNDAQKVARLAITKIQKGEFPPTISNEELKKLNVIK